MNKNERTMNISNTLKELGISPGLMGYHYLKHALEVAMEDPTIVFRMTKELYPEVGRKFSVTWEAAERGMRHAIEQGWLRGNQEQQDAIFGYSLSPDLGRPTNGEFVATVVDYLLLKEEETNGSGQ